MPVTESSEQNNKKSTTKETASKGYVVFTQFILEVLIFVGGAIAIGLYLDKRLNTKCLFLLILLFLFGFVPIYNLVKRMNKEMTGNK